MPTKFEATRQTKAPLPKTVDYFMHLENMPKIHPDFVKDVKITSKEGDTMTFEEHLQMMGRKLRSVNKLSLNRQENKLEIDTLEGDGKGSKVTIALKEVPTGTEVKYSAAMELGPLGFFAKGPAKSTFERTVDEDIKTLDAL
jgi:hypothetical protein